MNKYSIESATKSDMDFILKLNQNNMPAVSILSSNLFLKFLNISDYFKIIKYDDESVGFLIALIPNKLYNSINYQWFNNHYNSFSTLIESLFQTIIKIKELVVTFIMTSSQST